MKTIIRSFFAAVIGISFLSSCASVMGVNISKISIGMDKQTVIAKLKAKPNSTIGARKYPNGTMEVLSYITPSSGTRWLYFYQDKLMEISIPTRDWQREADMIVADNEAGHNIAPADGAGTRGGK